MIEQLFSDLINALNANTAVLLANKTPETSSAYPRTLVAPITPSDPVTPVVAPVASLLTFPEPVNSETPTLLECENIMAYFLESHGKQLHSDILESWSISTLSELPMECYADFILFARTADIIHKGL